MATRTSSSIEVQSGCSGKLQWIGKGFTALLDQGTISASGFMASALFGRYLVPEKYGAYALAFSLFLMLSSIHNALLLEPMGVIGPASYRSTLGEYVSILARFHFILCFGISAIMGLVLLAMGHRLKNPALLSALWGATLAFPWVLFFWFRRSSAYLVMRPRAAVGGALTYAAVLLGMLLALQHLELLSPFTAFVLLAVSGAGAAGMIWASTYRGEAATGAVTLRKVVKEHWQYGRWVVVTGVVYWLSSGAYYIIVGALLGISEVGALKALQNFYLPVPQFVTAMSMLLLPWLSARYAQLERRQFRQVVRRINLLFVSFGVAYLTLLTFCGRWLMNFLYRGRYNEFSYLLPLVALPILVSGASQGFAMALRAMQVPSEIFWGYTAAGILTIVLGIALTDILGLMGAVIGACTSSLVFLVVIAFRYRARLGAQSENSAPQDLKVAVLMPSVARGYYWQPLFQELAKQVPRLRVFTGNWTGFLPGMEGSFDIQHVPGFKFISLRTSNTGADVGFGFTPPALLWKLLKFRPDVIVASAFSLWSLFALMTKFLLGSRVLIPLEGISASTSFLDSPARIAIRRVMARLADGFLTNTREGAEYLRAVIRVPKTKITQYAWEVPEPGALCLSARNNLEHLGGLPRPKFLFVGSLTKRKGANYLLDAGATLLRQGVDGFSVVLVGDGPDRQMLEERIAVSGLTTHVHLAGPVDYDQLGAYFLASDVFVLPTLEDTWGMVVLEAMNFSKPILCSQHAGSREMVQHGTNGFIFDPCKVEALASYMRLMIEQPAMITEFGARSAQLIASYTPARSAAVLSRLLRDLVCSSRHHSELVSATLMNRSRSGCEF